MATFPLDLEMDTDTGQLRAIRDPALDMPVLQFDAGHELALNGAPLPLRYLEHEAAATEHRTRMRARHVPVYQGGATIDVRRQITLGGKGLHAAPSRSLHLHYELTRVPSEPADDPLDAIWGAPVEMTLWLETVAALTAPTAWFGRGTHMRAVAIGGSGPREHVSLEDGPVAQVVPWLQTAFRSSFPGQQTVTGALYYLPRDERYVWVVIRRPALPGRIEFRRDGQAVRFACLRELAPNTSLMLPDISFYWGRGLDDADRVFAEQFDRYAEPPDWWYRTSWFWLHPGWQTDGNFRTMDEGVRVLMDEGGVNGFGIFGHELPASGRDCDPRSFGPNPMLGGEEGLRKAVDRIRGGGGHAYLWMSRTGMAPGPEYDEAWAVRGRDGRAVELRPRGNGGVRLNILNCADPAVRDYLFAWIEFYVTQVGITGIFWDSGTQPMPPDFVARPGMQPTDCMTGLLRFYEEVYRFGRSLSDDFFMWMEGFNTDVRSNAYCIQARRHGDHSGHRLIHRIAHRGPQRLVWRSGYRHDLASGFPFVSPSHDIGLPPTAAAYRKIARDPVNRWLTETVRERGCRAATGVGDGVSRLDEFIVVSPDGDRRVTLPAEACPGRALKSVLGGQVVRARTAGDRLRFALDADGPWEFVS